jgi:uncharacterized protein with HEPN domain
LVDPAHGARGGGRSLREDTLRLADMLEALERIRGFSADGRARFLADPMTQEAVAYELLKLGEAAGRVSKTLRRGHPEVPWGHLVELRNEIVHEYFRVDSDALWQFVERELDVIERGLRPLVPKRP